MSKLEANEITEVAKPPVTAEDMVYVTIPANDLFDHTHPGVQLNRHRFEAGKTYRVRQDVANEVQMRLNMFSMEQVRLLRPNADKKALSDVNRGSQWTSRGGGQTMSLDGGLGAVAGDTEKVYTVEF